MKSEVKENILSDLLNNMIQKPPGKLHMNVYNCMPFLATSQL